MLCQSQNILVENWFSRKKLFFKIFFGRQFFLIEIFLADKFFVQTFSGRNFFRRTYLVRSVWLKFIWSIKSCLIICLVEKFYIWFFFRWEFILVETFLGWKFFGRIFFTSKNVLVEFFCRKKSFVVQKCFRRIIC